MRVAFYFTDTFDWSGEDLERGLGGAETALVGAASALAAAGCTVTVFNRTSRSAAWRGVAYRPAASFSHDEPWDVLVSVSAVPEVERARAGVRVHLSMEDSESWVRSYRDYLPRVDALFALSPHHARLLVERHGVDPARIQVVPLGVEGRDYAAPEPKHPYQLLYCSVPDCGLEYLPEILRRVRRQVPQATLVVTGDLTLWGRSDPGLAPYLAGFAGLPGVRVLGRVPRRELVRLQKASALHVYPCVCDELFCLSSLECQAAGTPTVAPAVAALTSTVLDGETGVLVPFPMDDPRAAPRLAAEVAGLLRDRRRLARLAAQARRRALASFTWDAVAGDWLARFRRLLAGRRGG